MSDTQTNPYVGPRSFKEEEKALFFGRDMEGRELLSLVLSERIVLFYAQSGAGKSSLINARLRPNLMEKRFFVFPVGRVSGEFGASSQKRQLKANNVFVFNLINHLNDRTSGPKPKISTRTSLKKYLGDYLDLAAGTNEVSPREQPQMLMIDQFEEMITSHPEAWQHQAEFFEQLGEVLGAFPRLRLLLVLREDFLAPVDRYSYLIPGRMSARYYMQRLKNDAAVSAVQKPAALFHRPFEKDVAEELVRRLTAIKVEGKPTGSYQQFVEPLLLQVVCYQLWEKLRARAGATISLKDLDEADIDSALASYYQNTLSRVMQVTGLSEGTLRKWVDESAYTRDGHRRIIEKARADDLPGDAIKIMVEEHFLNPGQRNEFTWYELSHDLLVEPVRRSNAAWREANQSLLQKAAREWQARSRPIDHLLTGVQLVSAREWAAIHHDEMEDVDRQFLDASNKIQEKTEQEAKLRIERRTNLADLGWGVIFPATAGPEVREALRELLDHRKKQAGEKQENFYHEFHTGGRGFRPNDTARSFLNRNQVGWSQATPDKMPYYLLIVGDPETIPLEFQYELSLQYAVGRISFETLEEYAQYAHSVVTCETGGAALPREMVVFSPRFPGDAASQMGNEYLIEPLMDTLMTKPDWHVHELTGSDATRANFSQMLCGSEAPAFLFTMGYGMGLKADSEFQNSLQGAIVCQDWPGRSRNVVDSDLFAARDVDPGANILGSVGFLFNAFSAATPRFSNFSRLDTTKSTELAPKTFLSHLPQRLLSHPKGGFLGVIGKVDQLWSQAFRAGHVTDIQAIQQTIERIMDGHTLGSAIQPLNHQYAMLYAALAERLLESDLKNMDDQSRFKLDYAATTAINARNIILLGDPAARLPLVAEGQKPFRPVLTPPVLDPALLKKQAESTPAEPAEKREMSF